MLSGKPREAIDPAIGGLTALPCPAHGRQDETWGEGTRPRRTLTESLVVYDSKFGNTRKLAEAIADGLRRAGSVRLMGLDKVPPTDLGTVDLLVVGGPTQVHGMSARIRQFVDLVESRSGTGMVAATFDTRFRIPAALSGSAAKQVARKLRRAGIRVFGRPQSFFVSRGVPELEQGEAERATEWAKDLAASLALSQWCAA